MKLSAPVYRLKHRARVLAQAENLPLLAALDRVAAREGYASWSALAAHFPAVKSASAIFERIKPGDMVLSAARPGQGKTLLALQMASSAMQAGHRAYFFSLDYTIKDVIERFDALGHQAAGFSGRFVFDDSDAISSNYVLPRLSSEPYGTLAVIDYLQLLDQRRDNPALDEQIRAFAAHARRFGHVFVFVAQINRRFETSNRAFPALADLRLPNAVDLKLFNKACFVHAGSVKVMETA